MHRASFNLSEQEICEGITANFSMRFSGADFTIVWLVQFQRPAWEGYMRVRRNALLADVEVIAPH